MIWFHPIKTGLCIHWRTSDWNHLLWSTVGEMWPHNVDLELSGSVWGKEIQLWEWLYNYWRGNYGNM